MCLFYIEGLSPYRAVNTLRLGYTKTSLLMLCKAKESVCSEIRKKHTKAVREPYGIYAY